MLPPERRSMLPALRGERLPEVTLCGEHLGNAGVRRGRWRLVREHPGPWGLYDVAADRSESTDLAQRRPGPVAELATEYQHWAQRVGVVPRDRTRTAGSAPAPR
ncbi:hypothetical protein ACQEVC_27535 [Plantactinospora sp. CA-294935]|uniref:hypothetical protein n=1 Tax=Plantactinospora sp. CA-294935 TaxID=3240012 RepID=UPI003D904BD2